MPSAKSLAVTHRVFRIDEATRTACKMHRTTHQQTVAGFVTTALNDELPALVSEIKAAGIMPAGKSARPARLPFVHEGDLQFLKDAAISTGLDQAVLLLACLRRACRTELAKLPAKAPKAKPVGKTAKPAKATKGRRSRKGGAA